MVSKSQSRTALATKRALLADAVLDVGLGLGNGLYVWGRPGTGKSHTVQTALASKKIPFHYQQGHANPLPLFLAMQEYPDGIHVLDDTTEIFKSFRGLEIVKAALGSQKDGRRIVTYQIAKERMKVIFKGGVVAISNEEKINTALQSRIAFYHFDLTDDEMDEALEELVSCRWSHREGHLTIRECYECLKQLRAIKSELQADGQVLRLDLRSLTHHAYPIYLSGKLGHAQMNWIDRLQAALRACL